MSSGSNTLLRVRDNDNGGEGIARLLDATGFADLTLSFDYARFGLDVDEYIDVNIVTSGGTYRVGVIDNLSNEPDDSVSSLRPRHVWASDKLHLYGAANI